MIFLRFYTACFLFLFPCFSIIAEMRNELLADHQIKEFKLKNGMRVCLKQTDFEEDEFIFQLFAMGGYAALKTNERPSGMLAASIAWESGVNQQSSDQIACELYQRSLEMTVGIQLFDRLIEGSGPSTEMPYCFDLIQALFKDPVFSPKALKCVLSQTQAKLESKMKSQAPDASAKDIFLKENLQDWDRLHRLSSEDLKQVDLHQAEQIFKRSFANPSDFTLIIVGDFNVNSVASLLDESLGSIPAKPSQPLVNPDPPPFPKGVTKKTVKGYCRHPMTLTRLTFPILTTDFNPSSLDLLCRILLDRLSSQLPDNSTDQLRLEVQYEFPLFPRLDKTWLIVQFYTFPSKAEAISQSILKIMADLKKQGPAEEEWIKCFDKVNPHKVEENTYILSLLSNYYRGNWDLANLYKKHSAESLKQGAKNTLDSFLDLNHYSLISLQP